MRNIFESVYDDLYDNGELYTLDECDGGAAVGGDAGGGISGGGITSDAVLGPGGGMEKGEGCLGKGDFHVPFPVMPCLFRYPCCNGGSKNKKKKGKKTVSVKNPYVKGMKTIIAEDGNGTVVYAGNAKEEYDKVTGGQENVFTGVLYYNDLYKLAWMVREDGVLHMYKPMNAGSFWTVYATVLTEDGMIKLDYKAGKYPTEQQALDAVYKAAQAHKANLQEMMHKLDEQRFTPRDLMDMAMGKIPGRRPGMNVKAIEQELKRRYAHEFQDVHLEKMGGRLRLEFVTPLPNGLKRITGFQRVQAQAIPGLRLIMTFINCRNFDNLPIDISAVAP